MTDRSSEERSRSNEETPKWVQTVASVRGELMTRFSDRLSMEEIASCAYAVAALEDRQEAAPICQFCHVEMKHQPSCLVDEPVFTCDNPSCKAPQYVSGATSEAANDRQEAAPTNELHKEHCPECDNDWNCYCTNGPVGIVVCPDCESSETSEKERLLAQEWGTETASPGVPSEATPSKENAWDKVCQAEANEGIYDLKDSVHPAIVDDGRKDAALEPADPQLQRGAASGFASFDEIATDEIYQREAIALAEGAPGISMDVFQQDWMPGFASFRDDGSIADGAHAHVTLNLGSLLSAVRTETLDKRDLPYLIAESLMHEAIHCLESWAEVEFSEERVEALLTAYREKYSRATIWEYTGSTPRDAAPAPEVQGMPKIDPEWPWTAEQVAAESPVGTPQKETPTMPYGAGAQNFGAVPEGVQGKEPQTAEEDAFGDWYTKNFYGLVGIHPKWIAERGFEAGFALGEAAGRRSAALLEKDLFGALKAILATVGAADYDDVQLVDTSAIERAKTVVACAELQEKTK